MDGRGVWTGTPNPIRARLARRDSKCSVPEFVIALAYGLPGSPIKLSRCPVEISP